ncbi:MAG: NmrA family NAD(P)-binding protein [Proteobacteria bacterium]|nr:NmrA family NAD(P)-binding protein [Pseudomonadota bacterium]
MAGPVLVTGATGNVGSAVVASLQAAGLPVRVADIDAGRLRRAFPQAEAVRLDFHDPTTFGPAVMGASALFLLRPPAISRVASPLGGLVAAAEAAGTIGHIVFLSVAGAETNRLVPHHRVERRLVRSPLPWTILRPGFFAQNLATAYRDDVVRDGRVHVPAGGGRVAFVDVRDLGDVTARVLTAPAEHADKGYTLTGPEAITFDDVAAVLSTELGRTVRYEPATVGGYLRHLRSQHLPLAHALVQTVLHVGLRRGQAETVDPTLERLLGRPGRTLAQYVADHPHLWSEPVESRAADA